MSDKKKTPDGPEAVSYALFFDPEDPNSVSVTKQSFKDAVDINKIMARWHKTGEDPRDPKVRAIYSEFPTGDSLLDTLTRVQNARQNFSELPSDIRNKFDNDPAKLVDFVRHADNLQEAISLGLIADAQPPGSDVPPSDGPDSGGDSTQSSD